MKQEDWEDKGFDDSIIWNMILMSDQINECLKDMRNCNHYDGGINIAIEYQHELLNMCRELEHISKGTVYEKKPLNIKALPTSTHWRRIVGMFNLKEVEMQGKFKYELKSETPDANEFEVVWEFEHNDGWKLYGKFPGALEFPDEVHMITTSITKAIGDYMYGTTARIENE